MRDVVNLPPYGDRLHLDRDNNQEARQLVVAKGGISEDNASAAAARCGFSHEPLISHRTARLFRGCLWGASRRSPDPFPPAFSAASSRFGSAAVRPCVHDAKAILPRRFTKRNSKRQWSPQTRKGSGFRLSPNPQSRTNSTGTGCRPRGGTALR